MRMEIESILGLEVLEVVFFFFFLLFISDHQCGHLYKKASTVIYKNTPSPPIVPYRVEFLVIHFHSQFVVGRHLD